MYMIERKSLKKWHIISQFRDCPLENEGVDLDCENLCAVSDVIKCWKRYFYKKMGVNYDD